ncbi:TPA: hypothetical protein KKX05_002752 [Legionella pneumophila]|nr:hypothetical protein [Legionella pneumophila]HAT7956399.1 hypothetical protein [Legionella pneumophila]HAU1384777.1 hypothetical protein [Legionella pneumophila]HAU2065930.1 hypothetical protein [Legionella pneumophila]HBD7206065.1 hypothetical protein [Legionella pneumophila]|tara:strand:- start:44 stop:277 length:234 start_codon:yes stop_codon:yes gene_type:complete
MTIGNRDDDDLNVNDDSETHEKKDFLLNQENFERLMKIQRDIEAETEMRPTFKKLINALVTDEALLAVKQRLIEQMS